MMKTFNFIKSTEFIGLVLAGGKSSRMGADKSYLLFRGETFLSRACNCLANLNISPVFVSGAHANYTCIEDKWPNAGPAAAIISAILHFITIKVNAQYLVVIPVDMPLLSHTILIKLMKCIKNDYIEASFVKNEPLPCCIKIAALKGLIKNYCNKPDISIYKLLTDKLQYENVESRIEIEKENNLININTPSEFFKLNSRHKI